METSVCRRRRRTLVLLALSVSPLPVLASAAFAAGVLPAGGNFATGSGTIAGTARQVAVTQSSQRAIIDWSSFSIGQGNSVRINNGAGATLNRVTGSSPSTIAGSLTSTGSTYLINENGIVVTPTGKVLTGGSFVASTRDTDNNAFMQGGNLEFTGTSSGTVVNQGTITANGADVVLIGKSATNSGRISARKGTAGLVAGDDVLLQPSGTGLQIQVKTGSGDATNTGAIAAAQAVINAAGGNVYALAGNNGGLVRATGTAIVSGHIWLTAGGSAQVAGTLAAQNADGSGGAIDVQGRSINVSGTLNANATARNGNGGHIKVGSPAVASTTVSGTLTARGGTRGGNGGSIETSGELLNSGGITVDTRAPNGATGNWTLDPYNVTIASGQTFNNGLSAGNFSATGNDSVISVTDLQNALQTTNVIITTGSGGSQSGDITVAVPVTWSANMLTLDAYHSININATMSAAETAGLTLKTDDGGTGGDFYFNGGNVTFANVSEALTINGASYTLLGSMADVQAINNNLSGNYALANSFDASGTIGWNPVGTNAGSILNGSNGFSGIFEGLGNKISNLTVSLSPTTNFGGLFGVASGTIRDTGVIGGTISSGSYAGGLVALLSYGNVINSYTTASVSADTYAGGLVGFARGSITRSFATGAVSGGADVGGLVGFAGLVTIRDTYATGVVTGRNNSSSIGGLVGQANNGSISSSYATGTVSGGNLSSQLGGLVGGGSGNTTITSSYWDTQSTGQPASAGGTGQTTAQLQGVLPAGFDSSVWGTGAGLYPYLLWHTPAAANDPPPADVTVALTGSVIKTYDGTTFATLSQSNYILNGVATADTNSVKLTVNGTPITSPTTGMFSTQNVGTGLLVTVSGLGLNQPSADNYLLTATTVSGNIGAINPAMLTYNANSAVSTYGLTLPSFSGSVTGFVNGETLASATTGTLLFTSPATSSSNAGRYAINGSGLTANNGNYVFAQAASNLSALTINPAALTLTADNKSQTYGGAQPTLTYTASGLMNGDTTASFTTQPALSTAPANSNAGSYPIVIGGATDPNYTIAYVNGTLTINPAALTISAVSTSKIYDGTVSSPQMPTYQVGGLAPNTLVGSDKFTTLSESYNSKNVAAASTVSVSYALSDPANYQVITHIAPGTITARPLLFSGARRYDGTTRAPTSILHIANLVSGDQVTLSGSGVLAGTGLNHGTSNPGFASIGTLALRGTDAGNYSLAKITTPVQAGSTLYNTVHISFTGVNLAGKNFRGANLSGLDLSGANLAHSRLTKANFTGTNLTNVNFGGASLRGVNFSNANLSGANLRGSNLAGDVLVNANLWHANLSNADLRGAILTGANLTGANLSHANLSKANLKGAILTGANLTGANLKGAIR